LKKVERKAKGRVRFRTEGKRRQRAEEGLEHRRKEGRGESKV
jgi:hypothetical protein